MVLTLRNTNCLVYGFCLVGGVKASGGGSCEFSFCMGSSLSFSIAISVLASAAVVVSISRVRGTVVTKHLGRIAPEEVLTRIDCRRRGIANCTRDRRIWMSGIIEFGVGRVAKKRMGVSEIGILRPGKKSDAKTPCGVTKITLNPDPRDEGAIPFVHSSHGAGESLDRLLFIPLDSGYDGISLVGGDNLRHLDHWLSETNKITCDRCADACSPSYTFAPSQVGNRRPNPLLPHP